MTGLRVPAEGEGSGESEGSEVRVRSKGSEVRVRSKGSEVRVQSTG